MPVPTASDEILRTRKAGDALSPFTWMQRHLFQDSSASNSLSLGDEVRRGLRGIWGCGRDPKICGGCLAVSGGKPSLGSCGDRQLS